LADPALQDMVRPYGLRFDPEGTARFHISGTVSRPVLK
jgi:hypothetical protein